MHMCRLHAATHGLGSGKPLMLFLHGFPETWATWRHQLKVLSCRELPGVWPLARHPCCVPLRAAGMLASCMPLPPGSV